MVKHFCEEVPPQPWVRRKVWEEETKRERDYEEWHGGGSDKDRTYTAPHVLIIHEELPTTREDSIVSTARYAENSSTSLDICVQLMTYLAVGRASADTGLEVSSSRSGGKMRTDGRDVKVKIANEKSAGDIFSAYMQFVSRGRISTRQDALLDAR